jgi:hypothetical protein
MVLVAAARSVTTRRDAAIHRVVLQKCSPLGRCSNNCARSSAPAPADWPIVRRSRATARLESELSFALSLWHVALRFVLSGSSGSMSLSLLWPRVVYVFSLLFFVRAVTPSSTPTAWFVEDRSRVRATARPASALAQPLSCVSCCGHALSFWPVARVALLLLLLCPSGSTSLPLLSRPLVAAHVFCFVMR